MKKLVLCAVVLSLVSLAGAPSLEAQRRGVGGFLDWIHKLSGPRLVGPAATGWVSLGEVPRLRVSVARRWSVHYDGAVLPEDKHVSMWSFQPTLDFRVSGPLALGGGVAIHRFAGDFTDPFTHLSYPVYAQLRFPSGGSVQGVVSAGYHYFPAFDADDFSPLATGVSTTSGEWAKWLGIGLEFVWY